MIASYPNRNLLRGIRACIVIAIIAVTGVEAVVNNQMTNEQYEHAEKMAKTKLTKPELGMKVFVDYREEKKPHSILVPAVITDVNTLHDGSVEINVRYLDGWTINSVVALEDVFERDDTVSYENWTLDGYDPRTMDADGQTLVTTGSSSDPSMGAASGGAGGTGPSMGAASGGAGGAGPSMGAASGGEGGAGKKRKLTDTETDKQPMAQDMDNDLGVGTSLEELFLVVETRFAAAKQRAAAAEARIAAAEARAVAAETRAAAAEARADALQQQIETAEAEATREPRTRTRTRSEVDNHSSCHDYQGMGSGK